MYTVYLFNTNSKQRQSLTPDYENRYSVRFNFYKNPSIEARKKNDDEST